MNQHQKCHKTLAISDVLGTVHGAFGLTFEKYAADMEGGRIGDARDQLDQLHALQQQMCFLVDELSVLDQTDLVEVGIDPDQLHLLAPIEVAIAEGTFSPGGATPAVETQTPAGDGKQFEAARAARAPAYDGQGELTAAPETVAVHTTTVSVFDVAHALNVITRMREDLAKAGLMADAAVLMESENLLARSRDASSLVYRQGDAQARDEFDISLFDSFAVNPGEAQLVVGVLGSDGMLAWTLAGEVPPGAFTTLRQRLQLFADTQTAVELSRAAAAARP